MGVVFRCPYNFDLVAHVNIVNHKYVWFVHDLFIFLQSLHELFSRVKST